MDNFDILKEVTKKEKNEGALVEMAIKDPKLIMALLEGFSSDPANIKFKSAKILVMISETRPDLLYPHYNFFIENLENKNNILKWNAIDVVSNLTRVDDNNIFNDIFEVFYGKLYEGNLITTGHIIAGSPIIARSKPIFKDKITSTLLNIDQIPLPSEECKNITIGHVISAFGNYFEIIDDKAKVMEFVKAGLNNSRSGTRKKAEKFLKKWE